VEVGQWVDLLLKWTAAKEKPADMTGLNILEGSSKKKEGERRETEENERNDSVVLIERKLGDEIQWQRRKERLKLTHLALFKRCMIDCSLLLH